MQVSSCIRHEDGYMLVTAIMLLFVATVLGLMVTGSSQTEIALSGAQQRYEDDFNVVEGGVMMEARAVSDYTLISRNGSSRIYSVSNPAKHDVILSPKDPSNDPLFDPGGDMEDMELEMVTMTTPPQKWPMDNLLHSDDHGNDSFDYQYRVVYSHADTAPRGYDQTFSGYVFNISVKKNAWIDISGKKVGPKMNL